jgi:hypothetical protein
MILDGPPGAIKRGLEKLCGVACADVVDDAAPSISAASVLLVLEIAAAGEWSRNHLSEDQRLKFLQALRRVESSFIEMIESDSKNPSSSYAPLWLPYGHSPKMVYDSALTTIDILTLFSRAPWSCIVRALQFLATNRSGGALRYDPESQADVGTSVYFASICYRPRVTEHLVLDGKIGVLKAAYDCLAFAIANLENSEATRKTYCDTLANALQFRLE